jgi:ABC-2 type transport system permease protein
MAESIQSEGDQYFAFILLGFVTLALVTAALSALPSAISAGLGTGTLEALFSTPASLLTVLTGISGYTVLWALARGLILIVAGWLLGAHIHWLRAPMGLAIMTLLVAAYAGIGLVLAALILAFRTSGPLLQGVVVATTLLGGVYYPTTVIPSWIRSLATLIPMTYGLRALRRVMLEANLSPMLASDIAILTGFAVGLIGVGWLTFRAALRYARRAGSLGQY